MPVFVASNIFKNRSESSSGKKHVGLLFLPHDFCFAVNPSRCRGDRLAIVKIYRAFDGVGITVGTGTFPWIVLVVSIYAAKGFSNGSQIGFGLVDQIYSIKAVEIVADNICLGCLLKALEIDTEGGLVTYQPKVTEEFIKKWADVIHQADTGLFGIKGELKLIRQMLKEAGISVT